MAEDINIPELVGRVARAHFTGMSLRLNPAEAAWLEAHPLPSGEPVVILSIPPDDCAGMMIQTRMMDDPP